MLITGETTPQVGELDEARNICGFKKRCAGMGGLQQSTVNCEKQDIKTEKSPLSTPSVLKDTASHKVSSLWERAPRQNKIWLWTAVDHFQPGILGWVLGDRSSKTFEPLWNIVKVWQCYFYVTDGWTVYPCFIR